MKALVPFNHRDAKTMKRWKSGIVHNHHHHHAAAAATTAVNNLSFSATCFIRDARVCRSANDSNMKSNDYRRSTSTSELAYRDNSRPADGGLFDTVAVHAHYCEYVGHNNGLLFTDIIYTRIIRHVRPLFSWIDK